MSVIDIVILVVLGVGLVAGFIKGAVRQIGSAAGAVGGFIAARLFGYKTGLAIFGARTAADSSASPMMVKVMGCVIVFLAVWIVVFMIVRLLRGIITAIGLSFLDRLGGSLIMVVKCFLVMSIVVNVWYFINPEAAVFHSSNLMEGRVLGHIFDLFPWLMGLAGIDTGLPTTVN